MHLLHEKVAIVTGAQQGIGYAIAMMYSAQGATVVLCDLSEPRLAESAAKITATTGRRVRTLVVDVASKTSIHAAVGTVIREFGRIDILVNNAGILRRALIVDMQESDWDQVFAINAKGTFLFTQAVGPVMMRQRAGKIVNLSSCSAKKADPQQAAYNASKAAILGLTRVTALEYGAFGICCNAICPGATDTEMVRKSFLTSPAIEREWIERTALKRLGQPDDVARVAVFLASNLAEHVTGEAIIVSGGELMGQ